MSRSNPIRTVSRAVGLTAVSLALVACGSGEPPEAEAADVVEAAAETSVDETAYGFDDIDMDGDSELDADEFHEWYESPASASEVEPGLAEDPATDDQTGSLDAVVLVDALYEARDVDVGEPDWVEGFDWQEKVAEVRLTRQQIENRPEFEPGAPVNREYETRLHDYYGRPVYCD